MRIRPVTALAICQATLNNPAAAGERRAPTISTPAWVKTSSRVVLKLVVQAKLHTPGMPPVSEPPNQSKPPSRPRRAISRKAAT